MTRTFIAVALSDSIRRSAEGLVERVRREAPGASRGVGWIRDDAAHVTLKFIGYAADAAIAEILAALRRATHAVEPFEAEFGGPGGFPNLDRPRVLWVGMHVGAAEMGRLRDALEAEVAPLGFPTEERPFHPHLTLGRVKDPRSALDVGKALRALGDARLGSMRVEEVTLFKSDLRPTGAVYTPLGRARLGPASLP